MNTPPDEFNLLCADFRQRGVGIVATLKTEGEEPDMTATYNRLIASTNAAIARVQGNRSMKAQFTWADLRLCMAAVLRTCLQELEAP